MAIYNDVLKIAKNYLGLAAEEYIDRRCRISLSMKAEDLGIENLDRLAESIGLSATAYISEDKVKAFAKEILELK